MKDTAILSPIQHYLERLYEEYSGNRDGAVADYIPELASADPEWFGIAMVTVDGRVYQVGDTQQAFTIQSTSKALTYGIALEDNGVEQVAEKVGVEPSGDAFNSISLDPVTGRPLNPMINAGAIATTSLIHGDSAENRLHRILEKFSLFVGHPLQVNETVYASESSTGHRNRAIAHMLRNFDILHEDLDDSLELYFQQCSIEVTCRDLALAGATLANGGVNPITGVIALQRQYVQNVLSVMTTCGMYDYAGSWIYEVGMPAKSGVGGGILAVLPGQLGIGVFSPRLDPRGNSVRGIEVCRRLAQDYGLHIFNPARITPSVIRASYNIGSARSKRQRPDAESAILDRTGERVVILELHGDLTFGTAEIAINEIMPKLDAVDVFLLDMKRVFSIDTASMQLLSQLCTTLAGCDTQLFFVNTGGHFAFSRFLRREQSGGQTPEVLHFTDRDDAIEWCENKLIEDAGHQKIRVPVPLGHQSMLAGFNKKEIEELRALLSTMNYEAGMRIFTYGDPADSMCFISAGEVSIELPTRAGTNPLAKLSPGMCFGELALVEAGTRSADVRADTNVECYLLTRDRFEQGLSDNTRHKLLVNISRRLAQNVRTANKEIAALS